MTVIEREKKVGHPRIFVEVTCEICGTGVLRTVKEIDLACFRDARISIANAAINECLAEMEQYVRARERAMTMEWTDEELAKINEARVQMERAAAHLASAAETRACRDALRDLTMPPVCTDCTAPGTRTTTDGVPLCEHGDLGGGGEGG